MLREKWLIELRFNNTGKSMIGWEKFKFFRFGIILQHIQDILKSPSKKLRGNDCLSWNKIRLANGTILSKQKIKIITKKKSQETTTELTPSITLS